MSSANSRSDFVYPPASLSPLPIPIYPARRNSTAPPLSSTANVAAAAAAAGVQSENTSSSNQTMEYVLTSSHNSIMNISAFHPISSRGVIRKNPAFCTEIRNFTSAV